MLELINTTTDEVSYHANLDEATEHIRNHFDAEDHFSLQNVETGAVLAWN